jgi:uncharacterized membrane protein (DUF373 family)
MNIPTPHTGVHRVARRFLEPAQDLIVLGIGLAIFALMVRTLIRLVKELVGPGLDFRVVVAEVLFMLVMVEVVRLLILYLEEHRVAVDFMVELGIVATLREIVLRGVIELNWEQIAALSLFFVALGALLRFGDLRGSSVPPISPRLSAPLDSSGPQPVCRQERHHLDGAHVRVHRE